MKGAIADVPLKTINAPNSNNMMMSGANQNFFLSIKNPNMSFINSI